MNFFKKIFGGDDSVKSDAEREKADDVEVSHEKMPKETHDKEHNDENKKPKNVCEFC